MFTRSEFVAAGQPASRFSISQIGRFPQRAPPTTVEIYHCEITDTATISA